MTDNQPEKPEQTSQAANLLQVRRHAINLAIATERLLESLGYPIETAIITRKERRHLTHEDKKE